MPPAKVQSALLEAMEEHQVTLDGQSMPLPEPFFVIATQNPQDQAGTFPLPESQLDRFLMRVHLGYPAAAAERELLSGVDRIDISYFEDSGWHTRWQQPGPPALIRIRIVFLDGDPRHWPDIVAAPIREQPGS